MMPKMIDVNSYVEKKNNSSKTRPLEKNDVERKNASENEKVEIANHHLLHGTSHLRVIITTIVITDGARTMMERGRRIIRMMSKAVVAEVGAVVNVIHAVTAPIRVLAAEKAEVKVRGLDKAQNAARDCKADGSNWLLCDWSKTEQCCARIERMRS